MTSAWRSDDRRTACYRDHEDDLVIPCEAARILYPEISRCKFSRQRKKELRNIRSPVKE
jgi:hypothetical protein